MRKRIHRTGPLGYGITLKGVTVSPTGRPSDSILNSITLDIPPGQFVGVVGGNGAGKTTLISAIAGEVRLAAGDVIVGGATVDCPINRRIDGVGIVHQNDEDDLLHGFSVGFNVSFRQFNSNSHEYAFWSMPMEFGTALSAKLSNYSAILGNKGIDVLVGHLAGGVRQILNLIIGIHLEHEYNPCGLILLDEHTARLDHTNAKTVMDFTVNQVRQTKATAIMVTHRYQEAIDHCDRILVMGKGAIVENIEHPKDLTVAALARKVEAAEVGR